MKYCSYLTIMILVLLGACTDRQKDTPAQDDGVVVGNQENDQPPAWAQGVIWYQIFVERFRNGDPSNDPTPQDLAGSYPGFVPEGWSVTPWGQDWYKHDPYFEELNGKTDLSGGGISDFSQMVQMRRYGGDLQGVIDQLGYLDSLGITAIYFNPLNDAPSLHKYDPRHWRHIDRNFGPTPVEDVATMASEKPDDPATWQMTGADQLFVSLIDQCHQRGIRVILDYSWNHTGQRFWAIDDIRQNGEKSPYKDWYWVTQYDDPSTEADELDYKGWFGIKELPEIKEQVELENHTIVKAYEGNLSSETVKRHIFSVSRRWLDPDGDGDPSDGVDGFRLDVAGELPLGFWREYRKVVREINPQAYLVGEIWWEEWPDKLLDPAPFLRGDVFDAVMNYRWYRAARHFFNASPHSIPVSEFVDSLRSFQKGIRSANTYAMMNVAASHDAPRLSTSLFNKNPYKNGSAPTAANGYKIHKPDEETRQTQKLLLAQQFTYLGAPHIWAGDEMGMWGADDPACRKPLIWPDIAFETETTHPFGQARPSDPVLFDQPLFAYYQQLIRIRKAHPVLSIGKLEMVLIDDENAILAYKRFEEGGETILAVFNASFETQEVNLKASGKWQALLQDKSFEADAGDLQLTLSPRTVMILAQ